MNCVLSSTKDIIKISSCHRNAFSSSLSSKLHPSFTQKMLSWYLDDPRGVLFHVEYENVIVGYCGAIKTKISGLEGSSTSMAQYSFKAMLKALALKPWLIFHEENLKRIPLIKKNILLKLGLKQKNKLSVQSNEDFVPFWGLVVIGVDPAFQGKGIGSILLQEFEKLAKEDGVTRINLSVKKENSKAIKSYERNGWQILSSNLDSLTMYKNI
jgi:ribosomal protein S18 acetylase RimI-like enzyme